MALLFGFLRAVNVGGRSIKMAELRHVVASAGYVDVETFIAGGNMILRTDDDPGRVELALEEALDRALGLRVETFLRTDAELATIGAADPFRSVADGHKIHVGFVRSPLPTATRRAVGDLATEYDDLVVEGREVYWRTRGGLSGSLIKPAAFARALGVPVTFRNMNTVHRMLAKYVHG